MFIAERDIRGLYGQPVFWARVWCIPTSKFKPMTSRGGKVNSKQLSYKDAKPCISLHDQFVCDKAGEFSSYQRRRDGRIDKNVRARITLLCKLLLKQTEIPSNRTDLKPVCSGS